MLTNIIGQDRLKTYLSNELSSGNLSFGYIFEGDRFMGKEFIAQQFAEELTEDTYIRFIRPTEGRKNLSVNDIREMKEDAYSRSFNGVTKVYIIPNVDDMSVQCQNAFLKLLEEPPQDCVFILLAQNRMTLLETIRSRCLNLTLARYSDKDINQYLTTLGIEYNAEIVKLCNGSLNRYIYLNSDEFKEVKELAFKVVVNINVLHNARVFAILKHIKKLNAYVQDILDIFLIWYRDIYVYQVTKDISFIEFTEFAENIKSQSEMYTEEQLFKILDKIQFTKNKLDWNCNFDMSVDTLLLTMKGVLN